ncbi:MAG: pitrilysin family protein [Candidatus Gastranaerophilales bacterium]|nr:pitrilysin family protein [Candidatus Gastranaerophilales bacterium]
MIKNITLNNGIKLITELMPEAYSATVMIWINKGSADEPVQLNGISHFIEHMLFKGTENRTPKQIVQNIESSGGSINAFTEKEVTCYYSRVLTEQVPTALDVLMDMIFNSVFKEEDIELEKKVILDEITMYDDAPDVLVYDRFVRSYLNSHPISLPITGTFESVSKIKREDIIDFLKKHYRPENIVISIAGKFNENDILKIAERNIPSFNCEVNHKTQSIPTFTPDLNFSHKQIEQAHICIGGRSLSATDEKRYALAIADACIGDGMASRLFQEIREKRGLVYSITTFHDAFKKFGIAGVYAACTPKNTQKVLHLIKNELKKINLRGFDDIEIKHAKQQLKGGLLMGLESTKFRASRNARAWMYFGKNYTPDEICHQIDMVTEEDIRQICKYIFDNNYAAISIVGPKQCVISEYDRIRYEQTYS